MNTLSKMRHHSFKIRKKIYCSAKWYDKYFFVMSFVRYIDITTKTAYPANIISPFALIEHCCGFGVKWQGHIYNIFTKYSASERKIRRQMSVKAVETKNAVWVSSRQCCTTSFVINRITCQLHPKVVFFDNSL